MELADGRGVMASPGISGAGEKALERMFAEPVTAGPIVAAGGTGGG